ncbi:MAG: transcription antitermination factor NusB [Myxococcota bacterium]|nr:transcription antitermination factor NusB [Myxococcota bacterium]
MRRKGRECALQALYQLDIQGGLGAEDSAENDLQGSMQAFWGSFESVSLDVQRFAERLVVGVHEHINELDTLLNNVADNWCVDRMSHIDRNLLRLATYEILHCVDVPRAASINEAIEIGKRFGNENSARFVNGILDKIGLDREEE